MGYKLADGAAVTFCGECCPRRERGAGGANEQFVAGEHVERARVEAPQFIHDKLQLNNALNIRIGEDGWILDATVDGRAAARSVWQAK